MQQESTRCPVINLHNTHVQNLRTYFYNYILPQWPSRLGVRFWSSSHFQTSRCFTAIAEPHLKVGIIKHVKIWKIILRLRATGRHVLTQDNALLLPVSSAQDQLLAGRPCHWGSYLMAVRWLQGCARSRIKKYSSSTYDTCTFQTYGAFLIHYGHA
jgi:hypothetical protein